MNSPKILIADDDDNARAIVGHSIEALGFTWVEARDGSEALKMIAAGLPDLAVLDVMMPGASGNDVCHAIKSSENGRLVPVLMLTALDNIESKVEALDGGADDYLTKPFHFSELQARIRALLRVRELNTQLHRQNEELRSMQQRLIEQERKLTTLEVTGTAAHQLGQPLSAILLNCYLLERVGPGDPHYTTAICSIKADAQRMAELLKRLQEVDPNRKSAYYQDSSILEMQEKK